MFRVMRFGVPSWHVLDRSCIPHHVPDHYQPSALCLGLQAVSPHYLFTYLARNGRAGWESLAGALLAFTGVARCWLAA